MAIRTCQTCLSTDLEYVDGLIETRWCPRCLQFVPCEDDHWQVEPLVGWKDAPLDDPAWLDYLGKIERAP